MKTSIPTLTAQAVKAPVVPALAIVFAVGAAAQSTTAPTKMNEPAVVSSKDLKLQSANMNAVHASKLIGMKVNGTQGKSIGEIMDFIVNVDTGDVRSALLALDPGALQGGKAVCRTAQRAFHGRQKTLRYSETSHQKLEKAGVDERTAGRLSTTAVAWIGWTQITDSSHQQEQVCPFTPAS